MRTRGPRWPLRLTTYRWTWSRLAHGESGAGDRETGDSIIYENGKALEGS